MNRNNYNNGNNIVTNDLTGCQLAGKLYLIFVNDVL